MLPGLSAGRWADHSRMHSQLSQTRAAAMNTRGQRVAPYLGAGILAGGLLPLVLYWPAFRQPMPPELSLVRDTGVFEQWLVVIAAFGVKPTYMLLSLVWILWLWRRQASDLVALRWGMVFFLGG